MPLLSPSPVHAALTPHNPIYINGNAGFTAPDPVNGGGSGTENDPYIIENWDISAENANGIEIRNTTAHFIIRNCLVENGGSLYHDGIKLDNVVNGRVENCTSDNNYIGIRLSSSSNNTLTNNRCGNNITYGIRLYHSSNNTLTNNTCFNNWCGIYLYYSDNNTLSNNTCSNNGYGIYLRYSSNNTLSNNTCSNNSNGICLEYSNNNTLSNNTCSYNSNGIYFEYSNNNILSNNTCSNSYDGIWLWYSDNNRISNNTSKNNDYGIYLYSSDNNSIYHNNFLNNPQQAYENGSNYWDNGYPSGGNYWSDYTGVDMDNDGIGDTPYYIPGDNNRDRYPLMNPWPPPPVGVDIWPDTKSGLQGTVLSFVVTVINMGGTADNYWMAWGDNAGWSLMLSDDLVDNKLLNVSSGESRTLMLTVVIPDNTPSCTRDNVWVKATSLGNENVTDNDYCIVYCISEWTGSATFKLENLYKVNLYKDNLWLYQGSKLVVKFYDYDSVFENQSVIHENFTLPWYVVQENENVAHPGIAGVKTGVRKAKLWLVDNADNEISKIKGWETIRDDLWKRLLGIRGIWPSSDPPTRDALWKELLAIRGQWPGAPTTRDPGWVDS